MTTGCVPWWEWQQGKRPPGWTDQDERNWRGDYTGEDKPFVYSGGIDDPEARSGLRDLDLAPTLEIYLALQAGEKVPLDLLRPEAVKRYGLRRNS